MIASSIWKRKLKVQSPAPVVSSSPPASSSPHRRTQPQALRSSRCSSPVDRRGVTHREVLAALGISKQEIHWLRPVLKHFRTIRSSGLERSSQQRVTLNKSNLNVVKYIQSPGTLLRLTISQVQSGTKVVPSS